MWRDYCHQSDYEAVVLLHEKMQRRIGRDFPMLNPNLRPTVICMVREDEAGEITHFVIGEANLEICAAGDAPLPSSDFAPVVDRFTKVAQFYGITIARAFVPKAMLEKANGKEGAIRRLLESKTVGFIEDNGEVQMFWKWVPPAEEAA